MEYVINQMIIFSPAERALFIINERESFMPLSNPATRLLLELVTHHKEMLTRRHLMQRVWEDNGFVGSNNNLNGCISEIRKAFESLALDPQIIITIPKLGFILKRKLPHAKTCAHRTTKSGYSHPVDPGRRTVKTAWEYLPGK